MAGQQSQLVRGSLHTRRDLTHRNQNSVLMKEKRILDRLRLGGRQLRRHIRTRLKSVNLSRAKNQEKTKEVVVKIREGNLRSANQASCSQTNLSVNVKTLPRGVKSKRVSKLKTRSLMSAQRI